MAKLMELFWLIVILFLVFATTVVVWDLFLEDTVRRILYRHMEKEVKNQQKNGVEIFIKPS